MSDGEQELDKLDTQNARKGGPLTPVQRERKQKRFLKEYRESGNIKASCKAAGIARQTFYDWSEHDEAFKAALADAEPDVSDTLEFAAYDRAVRGVESFVVSMGKIVCEEKLLLDEEGKPQLDGRGKPILVPGKPIVERKYSDTLLITLLKARMPEKYKDQKHIEHSGLKDLLDSEHAALLAELAALPDDAAQSEKPDSGTGAHSA